MSARPAPGSASRFPGFDPLSEQRHWDDATRASIRRRVDPAPVSFFSVAEQRTAAALLDRLMGQPPAPGGVRVPLLELVDARLAHDQTDGWTYDTMPSDRQAWRLTLAALDADAAACSGGPVRDARRPRAGRAHRIGAHLAARALADLSPAAVWSLWTRYAATAFYSHPAAWAEIGFDGPAYPRGYRNLGIDRREGIEVPDAHPEAGAPAAGETR